MAKIPKLLKVVAGIAGAAGVYLAGRKTGLKQAGEGLPADGSGSQKVGQAAAQAIETPLAGGAAPDASPAAESVASLQNGAESSRAVRPISSPRDADAYHDAISTRAARLRAQIIQKALATEMPQELLEVESQQVNNQDETPSDTPTVQAVHDAPSAQAQAQASASEQDAQPAPTSERDAPTVEHIEGSAEPEPYQMIQDALATTELFTEDSDKAYKPTPFAMPE